MNIALIADIHGNAVALNAALADIDRRQPDRILCLGDVASGPQPLACLHALREREIPVVLGNADVELLAPQQIEPRSETMENVRDIQFWCNEQLTETDRNFVQSFQDTIDVPIGDAHWLLCFHGTPRANTETLNANTPDDKVTPMLSGHEDATIFAGGHAHQPLLRRWRDALVLNPGSIGMGYQFDRATGEPHNLVDAQYAWLHINGKRADIEFREVAVDRDELIETILASGMPHSEWYSEDWR